MIIRTLLALLAFAAIALPTTAETRTWKAANGSSTVEAEYVQQSNGQVTLRKADGGQVTVPVKALSQADQNFLASMSETESTATNPAVPATPSDDAVMGGDSGVRVELLSIEVGHPRPEIPEDEDAMVLMMGAQGVRLGLWLYDAERSFLGIDEQKSKVNKLVDDQGTDLLKPKPAAGGGLGMIPGFSMSTGSSPLQADVAEHKHCCDVRIDAPNSPAKGANRIELDATLVARFGSDSQQVKSTVSKVAQGAKHELGPITFVVEEMREEDGFSGPQLLVVLKTEDDLGVMQSIEFLDSADKVLAHTEMGSMFGGGFGTQINYGLPAGTKEFGLQIKYFKDVQSVPVPVKLSTGVGF